MRFLISETFPQNAIQLCSSCIVSNPLDGNSCQARAIWDTGASCSCISPAIAERLKLPIVGSTTSHTAGGSTPSNKHVVDIKVGNIIFPKVAVTAPNLPDDLVLIGMDIIGLGRFTVQDTLVEGELKKVLTLELP